MKQNHVEETIDRYVYSVGRFLPSHSKKDIEKELRTLITDMLEERMGGLEPQQKDIDIVLLELGRPEELAEQYLSDGQKRYLIGPSLYFKYQLVLKIVLLATCIGLAIASTVLIFVEPAPWYEHLLRWAIRTLQGGFFAFAVVTLLFAIFQRKGISTDLFRDEFRPSELPPVPVNKARIPKGDAIVSIVFSVLVLLLVVGFPQLLGAYIDGTSIPVFDLGYLKRILPIFILCPVLDILNESLKLIEGQYTRRLTVASTLLTGISLLLTVCIFASGQIWNASFLPDLMAAMGANGATVLNAADATRIWHAVTTYFPLVLIVGFAIELGSTLYKGIRYSDRGAAL